MAGDKAKPCELDQEKYDADENMKIICLGDSAVGKSKLTERFLMDGFQPQQLSTYGLTLYKQAHGHGGWQDRACGWPEVQRQVTYKNLST